jgi:LAGLIDADG endonuclease
MRAPVAQSDRASAFNTGARAENSNPYGGGCYIGGTLKKQSRFHDNTEQSKMTVQEVDLAWLAGIIDGEGCFSIYSVSRKDANTPSPSACLTITNSNCLLLNRCKEILGALNIKYLYNDPKNGHQRGRRVMRIRVKNYSSLRRLVELVRPFLVSKADQARIMLEFVSLAGERGKLSLQGRAELMGKIKELNQRGHVVA